MDSANELTEEFALVHVVFKSFAAVDEDDGDFVGEPAAKILVRINVNFAPVKPASALQLYQTLFDDLAEMAAFARIDYDLAGSRHWQILPFSGCGFLDSPLEAIRPACNRLAL